MIVAPLAGKLFSRMGRQLPSSLLLYEELGLGSSEGTNVK
jgi:hypothetical protein